MSLHIIPTDPSNLTKGENKVLRKIISLYSQENKECYLYIKPKLKTLEPDFILLDSYKGVCILEVKDWSLGYIKTINRIHAITSDGKTHDNPISKGNKYFNFAKSLFEFENHLLNEKNILKFNIYSRVIFPNIDSLDLDNLNFDNVLNQPPTKYFIKDKFENMTIDNLFGTDAYYIDPTLMQIIRSILFPEIRINESQKDKNEIHKIKALDIEQEKFAKRIPYGHYMISGVPGSGKTLMLIARSIFLLKENPNWKIKIVTYNKSLNQKIKQKLESYYADINFMGFNYENLSVSTFHALAREEANIVIPQNPDKDFWDRILPIKALETARPKYDAILIDEYQDFYDDWIRLCLALCKKHESDGKLSENLFLAGDRLQSIYNPKEHTWKSLGVNIIGRSKLLKHSYRSGKTHIELALDFLMADKILKKEVEKFYEGREGIKNTGDSNETIEFIEGDYHTLNDFLKKCLSENGYKNEDFLILAPTHNDAEYLYSQFDDFLKSEIRVCNIVLDNKIPITTYHSSKGLECKICILVNADIIDDKKLLYVGMTRASHKLCIHAFDYKQESFAKQLKNKEFEEKKISNIVNRTLSEYLFP